MRVDMITSPENRVYPIEQAILPFKKKAIARNFLNGFNSQVETEALRRNFNAVSRGTLIAVDNLQNVIGENLANMASHPREYTMSDPVVLNPVRFNEKNHMVNSESGYRILDMISADERAGAVIDFIEEAEKKLAAVSVGDMVIGISAAGPTGRFEGGKELIYEETQVYAFKKGRGKLLEGITFITDLTFEQCLDLYGEYGKTDEAFSDMQISERKRVEEMTRRPILITESGVNFENILDSIEAKMGGQVIRKANGMNRTFEEARELLQNPEQLGELPKECEDVLDMYRGYLEANIGYINDKKVFDAVKQRMEIAMLEITKLITNEEEQEGEKKITESSTIYINAFSGNNTNLIDYNLIKNVYDDQIKFLMTRPGCLGKVGSEFSLTGQSLGDILSGTSNIRSIFGTSLGTGANCKVCGINPRAEGGCGFCHGCASKAA